MQTHQPDPRLSRFAARHSKALMGLAAAITSVGLYGRVTDLPIYHDDAPWLKSVSGLNLLTLFTIKGDHPYYRPAGFLPWLLIHDIASPASSPLIHAYTLALFVACAWLAGLVARRFAPEKPLVAWGTVALFLVFPFTYQTVTWASAHVHLQPLACTLAAILLLDRWWEDRRPALLAASWLLMAIGIFTHENGPVMPALLAGWLLIVRLKANFWEIRLAWRPLALALAVPLALAVLYAAIWASLTHDVANQPHIEPASIAWNVAYLTQGIAHPVTLLGGPLLGAGMVPLAAAALLDLLGIAALGGLLWASKDRRLLIVPWWYAVGIAPAALFLPSDYIVDGPRMMTTASFAAVLAWAVAIDWLWERLRGPARLAPAVLAALMLASGGWFITTRMAIEDQIGPLYWQIMRGIQPEAPGVIANLPAWISPQQRVYALGNEGIAYLPDYFPFAELAWANVGVMPRTHPVSWPEIAPSLPGTLVGFANDSRPQDEAARLQAIHNNDQVVIVHVVNGRLVAEIDRRLDTPPGGVVRFRDGIWISASAAYRADIRAVALSLTWETRTPEAVTPFVHLTCSGAVAAQADGAPLGGLHPFNQWTAGERWQEMRLVAVPPDVNSACLEISVGLYHPENGRRVPLESGEDALDVPIGGQ